MTAKVHPADVLSAVEALLGADLGAKLGDHRHGAGAVAHVVGDQHRHDGGDVEGALGASGLEAQLEAVIRRGRVAVHPDPAALKLATNLGEDLVGVHSCTS